MNKLLNILIFSLYPIWLFAQTDSTNTDYLFDLSLDELLNLTIKSADKSEQKVIDIPASIIIIDRKEIEAAGYRNLEEVLENVPGLVKIDDKYWLGGMNYSIRGNYTAGSFNDMIILVNGVPQREDYYDAYNLAGIRVPVEAIERIEIVKGPLSVTYGSGAFMGVINIITKEENNNTSLAQVSYGTAQSKNAVFSLSKSIEDLSFQVIGSWYDDKREGAKLGDMATYPFPDFWGPHSPEDKLKENLNKKYFSTSLNYKGFAANISHVENRQNITDGYPAMNDGSFININRSYINFSYEKGLSDKLNILAKYSYLFYNKLSDNEYYNPASPDLPKNYGFTSQNIKSQEVEFNIYWHLNRNFKLQIGGFTHVTGYLQTTVDLTAQNYYGILYALPNDERIFTYAAYTQAEYTLSKKLLLVAGLRCERLDNYTQMIVDSRNPDSTIYMENEYISNKGNFIPRFALIYKINKQNILKLMYGKAVKNPSYGQNNEVTKDIWRNEPVDKPLVPAEIQTIELNYLTFFDKFSFNFSIFHNYLNNLLSRDNFRDEQGIEHWVVANSGKINTFGGELDVTVEPVDKIKFSINALYQKSKDLQADDIEPGYSPNFLGYFKFFYNFHKKSVFSLIGRYVDGMYTKYDLETQERIGNEYVDPYFVMDANLRFENIKKTGLYFSFMVKNLLNTTIIYPTTGNSLWADKGTQGYGTSFYVNLGIKF